MTGLLYISFNVFSIIILLMLFYRICSDVDKRMSQVMLAWFVLASLILCASDVIWGIFEYDIGWKTWPILSFLVNAIYHIFTCVVSYLWFLYSESEQDSRIVKSKAGLVLSMLPLIVVIGLVVGSNANRFVFYIDGNGVYHRGKYYLVLIIVSLSYIMLTSVKALVKSFMKKNYLSKRHFRSISKFAMYPCIAGILQVLFVGSPLLSAGIAMAVLRVYINSREQLISIDPMTQLNNRKQMERFLDAKMNTKSDNKELFVFILDLDYFKQINDKYGHVEGDQAIITAANTIREIVNGTDYFACRYGGDEFVIVCETDKDFKPKDFLNKINDRLAKNAEKSGKEYTLKFSVGYKRYSPEYQDVPSFIAAADEGLYTIKKSRQLIKDML